MSELGKIRYGSPRTFRDRLFGVRGKCIALEEDQSADGAMRFVFHPDDLDETMQEVIEENVADLEGAVAAPSSERWTVFGLRVVAPGEAA